jgi:hypothetical protein
MLPKVDLPIYELTIPSSGRTVNVRPFLVKEEKLLFMAAESNDDEEIIRVTKQILRNCVLDEDVNIDTLPFFDIDFLFIGLRAKSIGETIEMKFVCNNEVEDKPCKHTFFADIDISKAVIKKNENISSNIDLSETIKVRMKYPTYAVVRSMKEEDGTIERKIKLIMNSIDYIVDGEAVHSSKDYSKEELRDFIENLSEEQFRKLDGFLKDFPTMSVDFDVTCKKCGFDHHIEYKDFTSFFQ